MCGIAAAFAYGDSQVDRAWLGLACDAMALRGPDGSGTWTAPDGRAGLGHRRLSIIDLSEAGAQPMPSHTGTQVISFNGEIYNYRQLRADLERRGHCFTSHSDTEVLLHLWAEHGESMVHDLRGMFAFALWDAERGGLFLARDPYGIKPLYWADDGTTFRAASQVKALLAAGAVDTAPDPAGHVGFFLWGHVPEPHTLYRGVQALPAGHTLWVDSEGQRRERSFATIPDLLSEAERREIHLNGEARDRLRQALLDTVRHHLIADVDVGVFLSSGRDSTALAALASEVGGQLRTVTLGFAEYRGTSNDEVPLAEQVAAHYGAQHDTVWIGRSDFKQESGRFLSAMDQPSTDGLNSYFVSRAAAEAGLKVAVSGLGGDELFGGYPSFTEIPKLVSLTRRVPLAAQLGPHLRAVSAPMLRRFTSPKYAGLLEYGTDYAGAYLLRRGMFMPWELPDILDPDLVREGWRTLETRARLQETARPIRTKRLKVSALESVWYMRNQLLRDTDWASMAHSLEVRVPLVDIHLLRSVAPLLAARSDLGKHSLAEAPALPLPDAVLNRPKTGFTTPVRQWMLAEGLVSPRDRGLRGWAREVYARYGQVASA
ncbi:MAG: asparagine synthase (glutamine-hydrolyzing) [Bacteroidota bacterium]